MTTEQIVGQLQKHTREFETDGPSSWRLTVRNGTALAIRARLDGGWLKLEAAPESAVPVSDWTLLRWNAVLPPGTRFARPARLRAEIPVAGELDAAPRIRDACAGFSAGAALLHGEDPARREEPGEAVPGMAEACQEAGWRAVERANGRVAVDLGVHALEALVEPARGGVRLFVELGSAAALGGSSRQAVAALLIEASGAVRMARPAAAEIPGEEKLSWEVVFGSAPCASELGHALSALAVASAISCREARALAAEELAGRYLATRGINPAG